MRWIGLAATFCVMICGGGVSFAQSPQSDALFKTFVTLCPPYRGPGAAMDDIMAEKRVRALPLPADTPFLRNAGGRAWMLSPDHGRAVLVAADNGVCTLFARDVDAPDFAARFAENFAEIDHFDLRRTAEERDADRQLSQTSFALAPRGDYARYLSESGRDAAPTIGVTISQSMRADADIRLALSMHRLR